MVQQLAQQTELVRWQQVAGSMHFHLRSPVETLCSAASIERLTAALTEHFGLTAHVTTETGQVSQTANQKAQDERALRQQQAEQAVQDDPFVQSLMRDFGATIVPGSIKPV